MALDIGDAVRAAWNSPSGAARIASEVDEWVRAVWLESAAAGVADEGVEAVAATAAVAEGMTLFTLCGLLIACLVLLLVAIYIVETVANLFRRIPWVGGTIAGLMLAAFNFIPGTRESTINQIYSLENRLWTDITRAFGYFSDRHAAQSAPARIPGHSADVSAANKAIGHLQAEIDALRSAVNNLGHSVGHVAGTPIPADIATLPEQLHAVQANIGILYQNQVAAHQFMSNLGAQVTAVERAVNQLGQQIVGVRAVEVGFQDIVSQIQSLEATDRDVNAKQEASIARLTSEVAVLSGLSILLEPGLPGLRNLRKLEDNICQCPKFGGIGNDLGTAIALYEVVTNG